MLISPLEDFEKKTLFPPLRGHSRRLLGEVSDSVYLALAFPRRRKETEPVACGRLVGMERRDTERVSKSPREWLSLGVSDLSLPGP